MSSTRNKSLPLAPPSFDRLKDENNELKKQNKFLHDIVEVLYVQNQQFSAIIQNRKAHEKEQKARIERVLKMSNDLSMCQARNQQKIKHLDSERKRDWEEFCKQKTKASGDELWRYLESVKTEIMNKQYEELVLQDSNQELVFKLDI